MNPQKICDVPFLAPANSPAELVLDPKLNRRVLYQSMFSGIPGKPPALVRIDFERHEYRSYVQPEGRGSWRIHLLSDGNLWFGLNGPGQLACFNPLAETFEAVPPYEPSAKTSHLTEVVEGPDGRFYMPSFPAGNLVAFDRTTGTYQEYPVATQNHQLFAACVTDEGHIGILNGLQHDVYTVHPATGNVQQQSPAHLAGRSDAYSEFLRCGNEFLITVGAPNNTIEVCRFATHDLAFLGSFIIAPEVASGRRLFLGPEGEPCLSVDGGHLFRLDTKSEIAEPLCHIPHVPSRAVYFSLDKTRILMSGHSQYYGVYDLETGELNLRCAEIENPPIGIFSILPTSGGNTYCSAHLGLTLSRVQSDGTAKILGLAHSGSGEIYGSAEAQGKIYSVSYTHAVLTVYDPTRPWQPGPDAQDNPRNLGPMGEDQYRPVTGILNGPGGKLYSGTMPSYGGKGGALTIVDPKTDTQHSFRNLISDHSIIGLACGPEHVYIGTSVVTDGFADPTSGDAYLLVFDPQTEQVLSEHPIEDARGLITMGYGADKVFFWTQDHGDSHRFFAFEPGSKSIRQIPHTLKAGSPHNRPMVTGPNNRLFFSYGPQIVCLNPQSETLTVVYSGQPNESPILATAKDAVLFSQGNELWRISTSNV